ncbi:MAG: acyl-CoA/acyl-ACP dehydrogenase [Burkholderiales bacterium]|nr:acyl-CoA/acyl-ACP dehydrogenase [Burkholderiales bacterium]
MSAVLNREQPFVGQPECSAALRTAVAARTRAELLPQVVSIDVDGTYPGDFLRRLGIERLYGAAVSAERGGLGLGLHGLIEGMSEVSRVCGATGFMVWCQSALVWYLENTPNAALRERLQRRVIEGAELGGTGLSNLMKSVADIEELKLRAQRVEGGYCVNGVLPWVSNLGDGHWFAAGCRMDDGGRVLPLFRCGEGGVQIRTGGHFVALEGTGTFACHFKDVFVSDADVLAHPGQFDAFIACIKPGFIMMQTGIALGLIEDCIAIIRQSGLTHAHVNQYLDVQADELQAQYDAARSTTLDLARRISEGRPFSRKEVLSCRVLGSELSLKASMAAMLHTGAKGYLTRNPAQRRVREAIFVAIVTPAIKHLRKELAALEASAVH